MEPRAQPLAYTIGAFCKAIGIGRTKAYDLLKRGEIDVVRIGGRTLITAASVQSLLDRALAESKARGLS